MLHQLNHLFRFFLARHTQTQKKNISLSFLDDDTFEVFQKEKKKIWRNVCFLNNLEDSINKISYYIRLFTRRDLLLTRVRQMRKLEPNMIRKKNVLLGESAYISNIAR